MQRSGAGRQVVGELGLAHEQDFVFHPLDGLSDIANRNGETFGLENLKSIVADNLKLPNAILIPTIINAINKFTGDAPNPDDITVLTVGLT